MVFQLLQYEFLGPVPLDEWGPPMEKLVYLVLSRSKDDKFSLLYVGTCEKTEEKSFFVQHPGFKCWVQHAGSERFLHLAILPMFESGGDARQVVSDKIAAHYSPPCNPARDRQEPGYVVRRPQQEPQPQQPQPQPPQQQGAAPPEPFACPCCGSEMRPDQILERSTVFRCAGCGMSDTRLNP